MKREIKEQWIADLKSGKYSQSHRQLADENGYCCLGVLVDNAARSVLNAAGLTVTEGIPKRAHSKLGIRYGSACSIHDIPDVALPIVGLTKRVQNRLIEMNDQESASFSQIATYVGRHVAVTD